MLATVAILAVGMMAAAVVGFALARRMAVGEARFGIQIQVEEGIGSFDRLPMRWTALLRH